MKKVVVSLSVVVFVLVAGIAYLGFQYSNALKETENVKSELAATKTNMWNSINVLTDAIQQYDDQYNRLQEYSNKMVLENVELLNKVN